MSSEYVLETQGLTREFAGFFAVKDVNLKVRPNTIHAMIGPNGAGKTTVFNLLTKFLVPTAGRIFYKGEEITKARPADIARHGLVRSFQISAVFAQLSVFENVRLALQRSRGHSLDWWRSERVLRVHNARAHELLAQVGLEDQADRLAGELPYGRKRALELATTLALEPQMLLLDEPTSGMGSEDIAHATELIRAAALGRTVLMVEHNLSVVANLCDRITVLAQGEVLAEGDYASIAKHEAVVQAYLGKSTKSRQRDV